MGRRRAYDLLAELDAAYFHLYGLSRDEVEYIFTTFQAHRPDASTLELFSHGAPILETYDRLAQGSRRARLIRAVRREPDFWR